MISEILMEVSVPEEINDATSEWVLKWAQKVETQRVQKKASDNIKAAKHFVSIGPNTLHCTNERHTKQKQVENCNYSKKEHPQRQCPAQGKT